MGFHAAAVFKHFQLTREMKKNISTEELAKMASRVLAACLCVPLPSQHPEFDRFIETDRSPAEKMARLAVLLALSQPPTRLTLLKDCVRFGVVVAAGKELQDLYNWLEGDFHPLNLWAKVDEKLKFIDESDDFSPIKQYTEPLRDMTLVRLLKQVAQVYQSVSMKRLLSLTKFSTHHHMERLIVECARNNDMQVRIDHRTGSVHFGTDLSEAQRTDLPEGPHTQSMPSEQVRTQLMSMMSVLDKLLVTRSLRKERNGWRNITMPSKKLLSRARGRKLKGRRLRKPRDCKLREKSVRSKGRRMRSRISRLSTLGIRLLSWLTLRLVRKSWKVCKLRRLPRWMLTKSWLNKLRSLRRRRKNCKFV